MVFSFRLLFASSFCLLVPAAPAIAADFVVTRTDDPTPDACQPNDCSLREAVLTSNALSGPDRIVLAAGLYILTIPGNASGNGAIGDLDIDGDVEIVGAGATATTILSQNANRLISILPNRSLFLHGVRLDGGRAAYGGAILQNGQLRLEDAILSGNEATADGGAIRGTRGSVLRRVQLLDNHADGNGGGIEGDSEIYDSILSGNSATHGGAIDAYGIRLVRTLLENNTATGDGGALNGREGCSCSELEVHESTLAGNSATQGGAIYTNEAGVVDGSTLSGNSASERGGAIFATTSGTSVSTDRVEVTASTLYLNTAPMGGSAIYYLKGASQSGDLPSIGNSLLAGTCTRSGTSVNFHAVLGNIESPGNTCNVSPVYSHPAVPASGLLLSVLADNGGPTPTHLPGASSALVGSGWNPACALLDQRGYVRADGACDVGAVERDAPDDVIFRSGFQ